MEKLNELASLYKIFGDETRLKILCSLMNGRLCTGDISERVGMSASCVSHQLKILKQSKLVNSVKDGKQAIYFLADDHVKTIIENGLEHVNE